MYEFQKRAITTNYIKVNSNNYQRPQRFRDIYINQSPTFYNQIRYDVDNNNNIPNMNQFQYIYKQRRPFEYYSNDNKYDSFNNSLKNAKPKNNYFFNNVGSYAHKAVNTMISPNPKRINKIYYFENDRTKNNSQDNKNVITFNKPFESYSYNEIKRKNKLYIENPMINSGKYERKIKIEKNKNLENTIAQKICNIVIQGEGKKDKNKKNKEKNKSQKSSENKNNYKNIDINKVPPKKLNLNKINNNIENDNQEQNEENEIENENENEEIEEREVPYQNENEKYFVRKSSNEEYEEEENNNNSNEYYNEMEKDKDDISKEKDEQNEEELNEQEEQEEQEQAEEEDENNVNENKEDNEEIEEDEQIQRTDNNSTNKVKKNIFYKLQKETEIELNGINQPTSNNQLNIIKDDNIEIHGKKKPHPQIYEINTESNIELISPRYKQLIEIEKVQNYEQPRDYQRRSNKKKNFRITKDVNNDINIIHEKIEEPIFQIEKIQNFNQERNMERRSDKKRNKIKKYKITKLTEGNLFIEKTEQIQPLFEIEKIHEFTLLNKKEKKSEENGINNNMNKYIIENIEDANFILEKIETEKKDEIQIQKAEEFFQKRSKEKKVMNDKKRKYRLKISKQNDCNLEIIVKPSIDISKLENIEIKSKYPPKKKKITNYKKLKKAKQDIYQYKSPEIKSNEIFIPKDTRFIFKGKPKKTSIKRRNSIKKEVVFTYKSPLIPKKTELSIGGNITNTIKPVVNTDKNELEHNIGNIISPVNSFIANKGEIEINSSQNQEIEISQEKEENINKYKTNTYPINNTNKNINNNKIQTESNQNEIITISLKGEKKSFTKKYISPRRLRRSFGGQNEEQGNKKITDFTQNMNNEDKNTINQEDKQSSAEMKKEEKNENRINNNIYYSSSFRQQKKEKNRVLDNNALFISARSSSSSSQNNKKTEDKKNDIQNNMNRIVINSSSNSPIVLKNFESSRLKTVPNDVNKLNLHSEIEIKKENEEKKEEKIQTEKHEESKDKNVNNDNKNEQISMTSAKNTETNKNISYNFLENYNNIDSQELSEYTKAYLNSYMSAARPELSDFSKEFLNSNVTNPSPTKPELSNITRAYLFSQNENNDEK